MTGIDDQNPLRTQLENDLNGSEWLQTFKAINQLLHGLKAAIAEIETCELRWDTDCNGLKIHCPSAEVSHQLQQQQDKIVAIASYADRIALIRPNGSETVLKTPTP